MADIIRSLTPLGTFPEMLKMLCVSHEHDDECGSRGDSVWSVWCCWAWMCAELCTWHVIMNIICHK